MKNNDLVVKKNILPPTEMMILKPLQALRELVISDTKKRYGHNHQARIEALAATPHRWLSIVYPLNETETNSTAARTRIMCCLAVICYLNDLKDELHEEVSFDFNSKPAPIEQYFEAIRCAPFIEEYPHLLSKQPVSYEPGINRNILTVLVYPTSEFVNRLAELTGLAIDDEAMLQIAQPVLLNGKNASDILPETRIQRYQLRIIYEMIGAMIAYTVMGSHQDYEVKSVDEYVKLAERLIGLGLGTQALRVEVNVASKLFWLPDPAGYQVNYERHLEV